MENISARADSVSKPPFSAFPLPALWLTKDDGNDTEVTESFPCIRVGSSALGHAEQHLATACLGYDILDSPPQPQSDSTQQFQGDSLVFADWWFPHSS